MFIDHKQMWLKWNEIPITNSEGLEWAVFSGLIPFPDEKYDQLDLGVWLGPVYDRKYKSEYSDLYEKKMLFCAVDYKTYTAEPPPELFLWGSLFHEHSERPAAQPPWMLLLAQPNFPVSLAAGGPSRRLKNRAPAV